MLSELNECVALFPLVSSILFILSLRGLSSASSSVRGNLFAMLGMGIAILFVGIEFWAYGSYFTPMVIISVLAMFIGGGIGYLIAKKISMTSLPQLLAAFHSLIGLSAIFISCAIFMQWQLNTNFMQDAMIPRLSATELSVGASIGAITFTGSFVAFAKLQGLISGKPLRFKFQNKLNIILGLVVASLLVIFIERQTIFLFVSLTVVSLLFGYVLIVSIGGADMPVVISMLNSYSGWAAAGIGLVSESQLLIIVGALVGTSGAILSSIMCKGMNRSLGNVIFGGFSSSSISNSSNSMDTPSLPQRNVKICSPEDARFILENANSVIIVPGYGMAVARAQHVVKDLADKLNSRGIRVRYAIHPVAGRMPGHMNVLLAEANIPYEDVFEIDSINHEFGCTDVVIVIGANDITNPAAKNDKNSPIYGMPVLDVEKARTVLFIKRSLGSGYAGIDNQLFYRENTMMILGDAKQVCENIVKGLFV